MIKQVSLNVKTKYHFSIKKNFSKALKKITFIVKVDQGRMESAITTFLEKTVVNIRSM